MFQLRYCDPITRRIVNRYFKSYSAIKRYIRKFNCPISFSLQLPYDSDLYYLFYDIVKDCIYGEELLLKNESDY